MAMLLNFLSSIFSVLHHLVQVLHDVVFVVADLSPEAVVSVV
jgi:hypothetical protein